MDVITPIISTMKVLKDVVDIAEELGRATHDYSLDLGKFYAIKTSFKKWTRLWAGDRITKRMHRYFWGGRGCKDVQRRLRLIDEDLVKVREMLDKLKNRNWTFPFDYVLRKKRDMRRLLDDLEGQISELDRTTAINYEQRVSIPERLGGPTPEQLATLASKSAIMSASLESLLASNKNHTLLAMLPDDEPLDQGKRYDASLWKQFRDDRVALSLNTVENRSILKTWSINMISTENSFPAGTRYRLVQDQDSVRNEINIRSSLQQCLNSISSKTAKEQIDLRRATALDRVNAAVDIAEWNLLTWDSDWTARLCICNVHCAFRRTDTIATLPYPIFLLGLTTNLTDHDCFARRSRPSRHIHLAVILAALLTGCQVGVVYPRKGHREFTVYADGRLLSMGTDEFLWWVGMRCHQNDRWVDAIRYCLVLDKLRRGERALWPQDFYYYNEHVLEPLERQRQLIQAGRTAQYGSRHYTTLQSLDDWYQQI